MALTFSALHTFVSGIADSGDATLLQPSNWNASHTISVAGATSGGIPYFDSATSIATSAALTANAIVLGGGAGAAPVTSSKLTESATAGEGLTIAAGTAASAVSALNLTQTWNFATSALTGVKWTFTDTSSHASALAFQIFGGAAGATNLLKLNKSGLLTVAGGIDVAAAATPTGGGMYYTGTLWLSTGGAPQVGINANSLSMGTNQDACITRVAAGVIGVAASNTGAAFTGRVKLTSAIAAGVAVASLNATPTTGEIQSVTDALAPVAGAAVAAGGAAKALVWWNGAQWTVVAV